MGGKNGCHPNSYNKLLFNEYWLKKKKSYNFNIIMFQKGHLFSFQRNQPKREKKT